MNPRFWSGKRVLLTGHTGFKGAWLALWLDRLGATVTGYGLDPNTRPALFRLLEPWPNLVSIIGDVRDRAVLAKAVDDFDPQIVIHLAAQALVRSSYADPIETFGTNIMGTAHLLDALRAAPELEAILVVTSDKVYAHDGPTHRFVEGDPLGGFDPYSASKASQEFIAASFAVSFFADRSVPVATARAGNVIGGGDWAEDRLVPDFFRSMDSDQIFQLRYPNATRPWQHVLEPLRGYLTYVEALAAGAAVPASLNLGPNEPSLSVAEVVTRLAHLSGRADSWDQEQDDLWPEHGVLELDSSAALDLLGWHPRLSIEQALEWTADWYLAHAAERDMRAFSIAQIEAYVGGTP